MKGGEEARPSSHRKLVCSTSITGEMGEWYSKELVRQAGPSSPRAPWGVTRPPAVRGRA